MFDSHADTKFNPLHPLPPLLPLFSIYLKEFIKKAINLGRTSDLNLEKLFGFQFIDFFKN